LCLLALAGIITSIILGTAALTRKSCKDALCNHECGDRKCPIDCVEICINPIGSFPANLWEVNKKYKCPKVDDLGDNCSVIRLKDESDHNKRVFRFLAEGKFRPDQTREFVEQVKLYPNETREAMRDLFEAFDITLPQIGL
jgi:hypothetical protein